MVRQAADQANRGRLISRSRVNLDKANALFYTNWCRNKAKLFDFETKMKFSTHRLCVLTAISVMVGSSCSWAQIATFEGPPIDYHVADVTDPVARLAKRLDAGELKLEYEAGTGYLRSLLALLEIPESSQALVFSKTSMQVQKINPSRPRAIYFNDDVYVGFCQKGEILEIGSTDPQQGAIFYSLKQEPQESPEFIRDRGQCLTCHATTRTMNVPGYLIRSVQPNRAGHAILGSGTHTSDHTSPFEERWGGWYVTGTHGAMRHMGNLIFFEDQETDMEEGANQTSLEEFFNTKPYLTPHSDLVALMVLEQQTQVHNAITAANFETREALHQSFQMNDLLERQPGTISDIAQRRISAAAERLIEYLLLCNEFQLTSAVKGTSSFANDFGARGKRDTRGRSLRELDLQTRLFKYPCSYLIYSESFNGLPREVRTVVGRRLKEILEGRDTHQKFGHITPEQRQAILEILLDTKPGLLAVNAQ
jgi:hypothetical protein